MTPVSQKEFAEIVGLSERSVQHLIKDGLPVVRRGKPGRAAQIDPPVAITWYIKREKERALRNTERKRNAEDRENQHDFWRTEKIKLETQKLEETLIDRAEVLDAMNEAFAQIASGEDSLPARLATTLAKIDNPAEVRKVLLDELRANRANIARELRGRGLEVDQQGSGDSKPAARKNSRRVGRRTQGATTRQPRTRKVQKR